MKRYVEEDRSFADGLEAAQRMVSDYLTTKDPQLVRSVASYMEAQATSVRDLGFAAGLRNHAAHLAEEKVS
ncbi:MAG: hypothetical protein M3P18_24940 [Actinomycetota bacterium]|nr:hypothetical protein [Actinomycetota bacterium]